MICEKNIYSISAYMDNELDAKDIEILKKHLSSCESCSAVLLAMNEEKRLMLESFASIKAPPRLKQKIVESLRSASIKTAARYPQTPFWKRLLTPGPAWAAVSLVILIIAGAVYLRTQGIIAPSGEKPATMGLYLRDVTHDSYLIRNLPARPFDIKSRASGEVSAYLANHVGFDVLIPDLSSSGYELKGGRLWHTISRISALAVYDNREGSTISLFEVKKERMGKSEAEKIIADGRDFYFGNWFGYSGVAWIEKNTAVSIVGKISRDELLILARAAARAMQQ